MEPLSALSLAATVIDLATLVTHLYRRVDEYLDKSASVPRVFQTIHVNLPLIQIHLSGLEKKLKGQDPSAPVHTASAKLVEHFASLLRSLDAGLEGLIPDNNDSVFDRLKKSTKSLHYEGEAVRLWGQILECRDTLTFDRVMALEPAPEKVQQTPLIIDIPSSMQVDFVGREDALSDISRLLSAKDGKSPPTVVLHGMGGQGKTQLALQFCIRNRDFGEDSTTSLRYRAIFWVDATSETATRKGFLRIYNIVKTAETLLTEEDAQIEHAKRTIQGFDCRWLIVFDNYDDPSGFPSIRDYIPLPKGNNGAVLVTSRHEDAQSIGTALLVPPLSTREAVKLLLMQIHDADDTNSTEAEKQAEVIVKKLGCHALAVHQVGCFINKKSTLSEFLPLYETERERVMSWVPKIWSYPRHVPGVDNHEDPVDVYTVFRMAFEMLPLAPESMTKVRQFLQICSHLSINRLWGSLFAPSISHHNIPGLDLFRNPHDGTWDKPKFQDTIAILRERAFVQPSTPVRRDAFAIHPLVADWLKIEQMAASGEEAQGVSKARSGVIAAGIVRNYLQAVVQNLSHGHLDLFPEVRQEILPHVLASEAAVTGTAPSGDILDSYETCQAFADFLSSYGGTTYSIAERIQKAAISILESHNEADPDGTKLTSSICRLARILMHRGLYSEAEEQIQERLNAKRDALSAGDSGAIELVELLESCLCDQGKMDEAEMFITEALDLRQKHHPNDKRALLRCRASRAWIWQHNKKVEEAKIEEEQHKILAERIKAFGEDDLDVFMSRNALGCVYLAQGKLEEAERSLSTAVKKRSEYLGPKHPLVLNARTNLSMVFASQKRWKEAIAESQLILNAREEELGPQHISTLVSVANLLQVARHAPSKEFSKNETKVLEDRLEEAVRQGLWDRVWMNPVEVARGAASSTMKGERRFQLSKLVRHLGSIRDSPPSRARSPRRSQGTVDPGEKQRMMQSILQQQQ